MEKIERDVAIIGAGPSGLFAVFECGFLGYSSVVIDALPQAGGQLAALYPEKPIYDIPGYPDILAGELVEKLQQQIAPFHPVYTLGHPVDALEEADGTFTLRTKKAEIQAKVVIIAGGHGMFTPRKPQLDNLATYEDSGCVQYAITNKAQLAGKNVVIAGGGDSAVDWANLLADTANHVHVVHRRPDFRAAEASVQQMHQHHNVSLHTPFQLHALEGTEGQLASVTIKNAASDATEVLTADHLLCFFGMAPNPGPFADWGLTLEGKRIQTEPVTQKTTRHGILAIGDMAAYPGKMGLILVGFAEAAQAAKAVQSIIDPDKKFKLQYSTSHKPGQ